VALVNIRLVAATKAQLETAMDDLQRAHRGRVQFAQSKRGGKGDWLAYGTLEVWTAAEHMDKTIEDIKGAGRVLASGRMVPLLPPPEEAP
jgi:hypothetical protein